MVIGGTGRRARELIVVTRVEGVLVFGSVLVKRVELPNLDGLS